MGNIFDIYGNNDGQIVGATWEEFYYESDPCCHDAENDADNDGVCDSFINIISYK